MNKICSAIENFKQSLLEFQNKYSENSKCMDYFAKLHLISQEFGKGYLNQKNYFNELKYTFKYMNKENKDFIGFYTLKKSNKEKLKKNDNNSQLIINNVISEYNNYNKRQDNQLKKLLFRYGKVEKLFSNIEKSESPLNIHKKDDKKNWKRSKIKH